MAVTAFFDCFSGASGDMILGALIDAGLDLEVIKKRLECLDLGDYKITAGKVIKRGIRGTSVNMDIGNLHSHHHRGLHDILNIIQAADLSDTVKEQSANIFTRLAQAEAAVHGVEIQNVHFHEVGAVDAIVDVVGAVIGLQELGIERFHCSALNLGSGTVSAAHGMLPIPSPATAELVKGVPVYSSGYGELLTPTGAAILTSLASGFGPMPAMKILRIGYGAGTSDRPLPNLLRVFVGERSEISMDSTSAISSTPEPIMS